MFHFGVSVTCVIMQKNGAGLHTASSCFWDNTTDGKYIYNERMRERLEKNMIINAELILW